jgi:hypothetical protein
MNKQQTKIALAVILVTVAVSLLAGASYQLFPTQEPTAKALTPVVLPMPTSSPNTTFDRLPLQLDVTLSQYPSSTENFSFNITQGETITISVTLTSRSNQTQFTTPLYLSAGAFENQPSAKIIASPPSPYPALPWSSHGDSPNIPKPFDACFDPNPLTLEPKESKTANLTITALENAHPGTYTMFVEMGNWEQTGLGGATFQLTVTPKQ